ncbi:serine hydrolase domain-containing protein [Chitinophaga sp. GCM10012297]|uniref:Beta-lactamase family protein n=1 Tax=Chitinophaga chungangae TaxID=2821488 RepID=A0ABS3YJR6_9BACT|nr:serine hydrolase domain-containing protein [Chitinophaga chungangae]MBO9154932.1 beta-lactamase family protein [Chitinophaga chungangae]
MRSLILLLLLPFAAGAQSPAENITKVENNLTGWVSIENEPPVRWNIEERLKAHKVPGITIGVIKDYKLEWAKGYGYADKESKVPVTPQTLFQAASISKSLNAVGILKLVQDGKLSLNEDINTYLKTWHPSADSGKITIANLLSHTAGLSVHGFPGYEPGDTLPTVEQILRGERPANTREVKPLFAPGVKMQYSGGGTTVTQLIETTVTGIPYDQYMQKEVLGPLGMTGSFYTQPAPANKIPLLATGYRVDGTPIKGKYHIYPEMAAAGLWTNPTDLSKYIVETQLALQGKSSKVLNQAMTKTRLTPYLNKNAALGVFIVNGQRYFNHNGGNEGFRCVYYGSLENGNGFVVMVNSDNFNIIDEVTRSIAITYGWEKDFYRPDTVTSAALPADALQQYVGKFKFRNVMVTIEAKDGRLYAITNNGTMRMHYTTKGDFVLLEERGRLKLVNGDLVASDGGESIVFTRQP